MWQTPANVITTHLVCAGIRKGAEEAFQVCTLKKCASATWFHCSNADDLGQLFYPPQSDTTHFSVCALQLPSGLSFYSFSLQKPILQNLLKSSQSYQSPKVAHLVLPSWIPLVIWLPQNRRCQYPIAIFTSLNHHHFSGHKFNKQAPNLEGKN